MNSIEERIEDYVKGKMSATDRSAFERMMAEDSDLSGMVRNYSVMESVSEGALEMELLSEVEKIAGERLPEKKKINTFTWIGLLFFIVAIIFTIMYMKDNSTEKIDQLFAENYTRPSDENISRSSDDMNVLSSYERAKYQFSLNDWEASEALWQDIIDGTTNKDTLSTAQYYLGHIYLNQYEWDKAKRAFAQSEREDVKEYLELIRNLEEL